MDSVYIFGASLNCYGVIKFIGKGNIISVIDNSKGKQGMDIEGVEIIGFEDFVQKYKGETIIIAAYYADFEIKQQLLDNGISNFITAPYMQKGYYDSYEEMISCFGLNKTNELYIYGENYFSENIFSSLRKMGREYIIRGFVKDDHYVNDKFEGISCIDVEKVPERSQILLTADPNDKGRSILFDSRYGFNIHDIYEQKRKYYRELGKYKNIHKGQRCFIIGNGPSLRVSDLNKLASNNEICFGCNFITKLFKETRWRPNYYVAVDYNMVRLMETEHKSVKDIEKFIADSYNGDAKNYDSNTNIYQSRVCVDKNADFSSDIINGVYSGLTVVYDMLQIAGYMGFKDIYLLGVDCNNGSKHFYESEGIDKHKLESRHVFYENVYDIWIKNYKTAEKYSKAHDFRIYNATRGGALEVFERVDFDSLF